MSKNRMQAFDLAATLIKPGLSVIEASAGTGKTWTVAHLVPRLLIDHAVDRVGEILLATFADDAAKEMGERVRRQLGELVTLAVHGQEADPEKEPGLKILLSRLNALGEEKRAQAMRRLQLALDESDQLSVSTIHSFCKSVLSTEGFLCGMPAGFEVLADDSLLRTRAMEDARRESLSGDALLAMASVQRKWSMKNESKLWGNLQNRQGAQFYPAALSLPAARDAVQSALDALFNASGDLNQLAQLLEQAASLNKGGKEARELMPRWSELLQDTHSTMNLRALSEMAKNIAAAEKWIAKRGKKNLEVIEQIKNVRLVALAQSLPQALEELDWAWLAHVQAQAQQRLKRSLAKDNALNYDGLIDRTYRALCQGDQAAAVAQRLGQRWKIGLIDESQDTDPRQMAFFEALFLRKGGNGSLILVGDPKQAIYGFRGGDLDVYLKARDSAKQVVTLNETFRSASSLVKAVNQIFGGARPFVDTRLSFSPATARKTDKELPVPGGDERLVVWNVPLESWDPWRKSDPRRELAAQTTATGILQLLGQSMGQSIAKNKDAETVHPGHCAVLVRDSKEAAAVYGALRERGIPAVIRDTGDVFDSEEAADLAALMLASLEPRKTALRRAALATRLVGLTSAQLQSLSPQEGERWLRRFAAWGQAWRKKGVMAFLSLLEEEIGLASRLAKDPQAQRRLTDLRHLEELVQQREAEEHAAPEALLEWFQAAQANEQTTRSERERRLERDGAAVQVSTMHKVKGLEFDFVFCPYLWSVFDSARRRTHCLARFEDGWRLVRQGDERWKQACDLEDLENLREGLRLTYVALTRAKRRAWILAGPLGWGKLVKLPPSPLDWLLDPAAEGETEQAWYSRLKEEKKDEKKCRHASALKTIAKASHGRIKLQKIPDLDFGRWQVSGEDSRNLRASEFLGEQPRSWRVGSFSSIAHGKDEDQERNDIPQPPLRDENTDEPRVTLADFAKGKQAGLCLHEMYEFWDFDSDPTSLITEALKRYQLDLDDNDNSAAALALALEESKGTVLEGLGDLAEAAKDISLSEWRFQMPMLQGLSGEALAKVFGKHAKDDREKAYAKSLVSLSARETDRMLVGFIDRIVRIGVKWGVVDWKSNFLGDKGSDYEGERLWYGAASQHYPLQLHLYLTALRRYLKLRGPGHAVVGGYLVFARGLKAGTKRGVVALHPSEALMDDLEQLFPVEALL